MIGVNASRSAQARVVLGSSEDRRRLRNQFASQHYVRLPRFLDPKLFDEITVGIERSRFVARSHDGIGEETSMEPNGILAQLLLLLNDPRLFAAVREVTGCDSIGCFEGRVYRMGPGGEHYDSWHNDLAEGRMVAMSVNLSRGPYAGGVLQMRRRGPKEVFAEVTNVGAGDAILFRLDSELQHRVTPVQGSTSKTAFAGWFKSSPTFLSVLKSGDWSADD
jgi:hypothetical protein